METTIFKQTIENYLKVRANADETFAKAFAKEGKSIDECANYIVNMVEETGCIGFADEDIFGMAVDYYDEDNIDPKYLKANNSIRRIVTNHQLTDEEKAQIEEAKRKEESDRAKEAEANMAKASKAKIEKVNKDHSQQLSLF